jgi:1-deoxy-D-xylulose-5-phosphate synthase
MSISPNVGALSAYLNRILMGQLYQKFKHETKSFIAGLPKISEQAAKAAHKTEEMLKGLFLPGILFEELGFDYVGPIDGHDMQQLIETLKRLKNSSSSTLLHVITEKGKGYKFSENNPSLFHGIGPFDTETGLCTQSTAVTFGEVFGKTLVDYADEDDTIIAISAAMKEGTGLECFADRHPERFYDVGIAEPHAVTFAAGLATQGLKPVVAIYSTFLQRAYDQIVHDVCLQNLHVVFAIDRAGIVGEDGPTHNGLFDLSYLRHIPNIVVMAPKDGLELKMMLDLALNHDGPVAIRYPRGKATTLSTSPPGNGNVGGRRPDTFKIGQAEILKNGVDLALIALGNCVLPALSAAEILAEEGISAMVVNARFVKPMDRELFSAVASKVKCIITIEENVLAGGFGSAFLEFLNSNDINDIRVKMLGVPDVFVAHGQQSELREEYGLDTHGIYRTALTFFRERTLSVSK